MPVDGDQVVYFRLLASLIHAKVEFENAIQEMSNQFYSDNSMSLYSKPTAYVVPP
jgi:hypothetical protein